MPSMANITVKKNDGTTDIIYNALTASAGDNVAAQWRNESGGSQPNAKPSMSMVSKYNSNRTARRVDIEYRYPQIYTDTTTGLVSVTNVIPISFSVALPLGAPDAAINEAVAQATNLLSSTLVRDSLKAGFAPT